MSIFQKIAFLFPGQGSQYPGMGKDFWTHYSIARETFEEADEILGRKLSSIVFEGPEQLLTQTKNSQLGIYVCSIAILRVIKQLFPELVPKLCAGLSLGEYTALTASGHIEYKDAIVLVDRRARYMNEACETSSGTMVVILGLETTEVEKLVSEVNLPSDLWIANYNCPGQIVLSGTFKGIQMATEAAKQKGVKRVLPLQVHGAFHSGLMKLAEERLAPYIEEAPFKATASSKIVMNVTGGLVEDFKEIRRNLIKQVTHSVHWEQGIRYMIGQGVDFFMELGCGKALAGFNKRIDGEAPFVSIEKIDDIKMLEETWRCF